MGQHLIKSWSRTQDSVTLSSAEAELVAPSKLAMEMLGVRSMAIEWCITKKEDAINLLCDASAALSIARQGDGKMRHINVRTLWLQEKQLQNTLKYTKIKGEGNPSGGLTKHVGCELAQKYAKQTHLRLSNDRAQKGLVLANSVLHICVDSFVVFALLRHSSSR